jgi:hypothetical protein
MIRNSEILQPIFRSLWKFSQNDKRDLLKGLSSENSIWIETGTYIGQTTQFLAEHNAAVISIEPLPRFVKKARKRLAAQNFAMVIQGTSEERITEVLEVLKSSNVFPGLLKEITPSIKFFLDGHNSGLGTYKGERISPIEIELRSIKSFISELHVTHICIDDWRLFGDKSAGEVADYPAKHEILSTLESMGFDSEEQHDVLVAKRKL